MFAPELLVTARALVILTVVAAFLVTGYVFVLYLRAWIAARKTSASGLTPAHVTLVSLATLIPYATLAWRLVPSLSGVAGLSPGELRDALIATVLYEVGAIILIVSLLVVGKLQSERRVTFSRPAVVRVQSVEEIEIRDGDRAAE